MTQSRVYLASPSITGDTMRLTTRLMLETTTSMLGPMLRRGAAEVSGHGERMKDTNSDSQADGEEAADRAN